MSVFLDLHIQCNPNQDPKQVILWILVLKLLWRGKRPTIAKKMLEENNKVGALTVPNLKTYNNAVGIKTVCYWQNNR